MNGQSPFLFERFSTLNAVILDIHVLRVFVEFQVSKRGLSGRTFIALKSLGLSKVNSCFMLLQSALPFTLKLALFALDFSSSVNPSDM